MTKRVSRTYLVADARERAVIPFIESEFQRHAFIVKQVTTADYLICTQPVPDGEPVVLAAIERKSHADVAASFKDGRHENIRKMLALRAAHVEVGRVYAASSGALVGAVLSMASWVLCASRLGPVTVKTLGDDYSMLIGNACGAHTFPYIEVKNTSASVEHEASTSKIGEDQIFYCKQRGISTQDAVNMIVNGFCKEVFKELPMEFAVEAQKLLGVSLEGSVG
jgi:hypothetical protein